MKKTFLVFAMALNMYSKADASVYNCIEMYNLNKREVVVYQCQFDGKQCFMTVSKNGYNSLECNSF